MEAPAFSLSYSTATSKLLPSLHGPKRAVPSRRILALRRGAYSGGPGGGGGGRIVDEGMIVLRKRIREIQKIEKIYEPPPGWMEWERSHYDEYNALVCEIVGFVQTRLMDSRPGLVLGMSVLIVLGAACSSAVLLIHLVETIRCISSTLRAGI